MTEKNEPVAVGDKVKDLVTNFQGIVISIFDWQHGCARILVQPQELVDGKPVDAVAFDEARVETIIPAAVPVRELNYHPSKFPMGAKVKDNLTGFTGVVGAMERPMNGMVNVMIECTDLGKDKKVQESHWFDAARIEILKETPPAQTKNDTSGKRGGPPQRGESAPGRRA